jgi:XTP/dITP diphosphohydrolase
MRLLLGTVNKGKVIEIGESLGDLVTEILTPHAFGITEMPEETGSTFAENARQKARFYHERAAATPTLADDSGIIVHALENELGVYTRRWGAGPTASDEEWIGYFLERMGQEDNKRAQFVCVLHYVDADGRDHVFEGICDGRITPTLEAGYLPGLPISACFVPNGYDQVYSALSVEEKNRISHRGKAMQAFVKFLRGV